MNKIQQLKRLSIRDYLSRRGIRPVRENARCVFYLSPLRTEHTPSFKVDYTLNLWHDFGTGKGGSIIDLVMRLENCDCPEAIRRLQDGETGQGIPVSLSQETARRNTAPVSMLRILSDVPLRHPALVGYLASRGIVPPVAAAFCREVRYEVQGCAYFAIGFRNDAGGWELRSKHFKGSSSPKHITTIDNGCDTVIAFEDFMDFLSYLTLKQPEQLRINAVMLNSVINLPKAMPFLQRHRTVHTFFDNDDAGRQATAQVQQLAPAVEVVDQAPFYHSHDDLNDFLQALQPKMRQDLRQQPPRTISKAPNPGLKQQR